MKTNNDILEENNNKSKRKFNKSERTLIVLIIVCITFVLFLSVYAIYKNYIPTITEYELVEFTTKENDRSYIEIQISDNNYDDYNK